MKKLFTTLSLLAFSATQTLAAGVTNPAIGNLGNSAQKASSGATFAFYLVYIWRAIIMIGGLATMAPERRDEVVSLGAKTLVSGTLATLISGSVVGILY